MASLLAAQTTTTAAAPTVAQIVADRVARLTKLLTLSTLQVTEATTLFTTELTALNTISTSLTTARTALTTAVEANSPSGITTAATTIGTLTMQQELAEGTAEAGFYFDLTADQQTKYKELIAAGLNGEGFNHGFGGGPGGGHH